jgi:ADP-ribosylglycohydrolase
MASTESPRWRAQAADGEAPGLPLDLRSDLQSGLQMDAGVLSQTALFDRVLGCLLGGLAGDALGGPTEGLTYHEIVQRFGTVTTFLPYKGHPAGTSTDDSTLKHILCTAILRKGGRIFVEDWADVWLEQLVPRPPFSTPVINAYYKMQVGGVGARQAGRGNRISNCSPMCIAPIGILHMGDPEGAVFDTYEVTQVIDDGVGQAEAAAIAAGVAAALAPDATRDGVLAAAASYLPRGTDLPDRLGRTIDLARASAEYVAFRARFYAEHLQPFIPNDPRESVPVALALFWLADGDPVRAAQFGANFGRDADTIACMAGALAGALRGAKALPPDWIDVITTHCPVDQRILAADLCGVILERLASAEERGRKIQRLLA